MRRREAPPARASGGSAAPRRPDPRSAPLPWGTLGRMGSSLWLAAWSSRRLACCCSNAPSPGRGGVSALPRTTQRACAARAHVAGGGSRLCQRRTKECQALRCPGVRKRRGSIPATLAIDGRRATASTSARLPRWESPTFSTPYRIRPTRSLRRSWRPLATRLELELWTPRSACARYSRGRSRP